MNMQDELTALKDRAERTRADIERKAAPWIKKRDALVKQIQPLENELRDINKKIKEIEEPARDAGRILATVARAQSGNAAPSPETQSAPRKTARKRARKGR